MTNAQILNSQKYGAFRILSGVANQASKNVCSNLFGFLLRYDVFHDFFEIFFKKFKMKSFKKSENSDL